ncbi:MAG: hypothetical protein Q9214_006216 [Letrouitia sp. 1 TL-2023]
MGGYKFLMRCYQDDDIFLFGFSRGAYIARFLAEMLDHVGLLSNGNEEMAYFAWKAFAQWQERQDSTEEEKQKKEQLFEYLKAFRETFSRPVRRIRFMGLFDTEVKRAEKPHPHHHRHDYYHRHSKHTGETNGNVSKSNANPEAPVHPIKPDRFRRPSQVRPMTENARNMNTRLSAAEGAQDGVMLGDRLTMRDRQRMRSLSPGVVSSRQQSSSAHTADSHLSLLEDEDELDEEEEQNIEELWFPGCHADLGGGWPLGDGEESALSHSPLVWMVREAQRAGLEFDREKMLKLRCCDEDPRMLDASFPSAEANAGPTIQVTSSSSPDIFRNPHSQNEKPGWHEGLQPEAPQQSEFHRLLHSSSTKGVLHDCLQFNNGLSHASVLSWKFMEYMPFRRMDLEPDGSWRAISLPLPMGEVRDIPEDAKIHHSAIRRMEANENYRPGNLIVGGGGRGVRVAPKELGMGEWEVLKNHGDPVGEVLVRKKKKAEQEKKVEEVKQNGK